MSVSLADGTLLRQAPFKARPVNGAAPGADGRTVFVTGQGMGTTAIRIDKQADKFAAESTWTNSDVRAESSFTTPILRDGLLFCYANAGLACLNASTGEMLWADAEARGRSGAIVDAGSCPMALACNGAPAVYRPSDEEYAELARYKAAEPEVRARPVAAGKNVFVRDKDSIMLWAIE